ncbi:MAG: 30S ribosomal protein S4e [Candidatus Thermoplasmatota archaeon]|nr:30S ribosomal protein S4e [Candidatus Thermoplasmatota archaeon]
MSKHLKQISAPRSWAVPRKTAYWTVKPSPGAHAQENGIPLALVIRDYLGLCETMTQAKMIMGAGEILVDGTKAKDHREPIGLMDIITIKKTGDNYRMLVDSHGRLRTVKIAKENAAWKLCRIENKTVLGKGKIQLNMHDGRCILVEDAKKFKTGDTLRVEVPSQKILDHYPLAKGSTAMIVAGAHNGEVAKVEKIEVKKSTAPNQVHFGGEKPFVTVKPNVFIIGLDAAVIKLPEVNIVG